MNKIVCVVGARPNFMKIAPVMTALRGSAYLQPYLVHTGQHYDQEMNHRFFQQLGIPQPDVDLEVGSASHAVQTAEIMRRFEPVLDRERPRAVLVVGDVNSTIACALVAVKKGIPVIHVEAGLRSHDRSMPEEINRVMTDQISDLLFTTETSAGENLKREGIDERRIAFVGNVMIDTLKRQLIRAVPLEATLGANTASGLFSSGYALLTLHRPSNVDDPEVLARLLKTIRKISDRLPVIFPIHPRTAKQIQAEKLRVYLDSPRIVSLQPLSYLQMLGLMTKARVVLTDSGGIQEETTALGVPCITLRETTERPITVTEGTNTVVGNDPSRIKGALSNVLETGGKTGRIPEKWDGRAAERIVAIIERWFADESIKQDGHLIGRKRHSC